MLALARSLIADVCSWYPGNKPWISFRIDSVWGSHIFVLILSDH